VKLNLKKDKDSTIHTELKKNCDFFRIKFVHK